APECLNYIVLYTREQCEIYKLLYKHTIREVLEDFNYNKTDVSVVITQIEAKTFKEEKIEKLNNSFQMHLFLTNKCNLRCRHCYMFSGESYENELSEKEIKDLLFGFKENKGKYLILSGGEVATRKDFFNIVEYAHNIGLEVSIMTNGTLWTDEMIDRATKFLSGVQVSIDGYNKEEYEKVRGKGQFEKAMHCVDRFVTNNIRTTVAITPWPEASLSEKIESYLNFEKSLKEKYKDYPIFVKYTADIMEGRELNLSQEEVKAYKNTMLQIADGLNPKKRHDIMHTRFKEKILSDNWCTYGHLTISAEGYVFFCGKIQFLKPYGNIREISIEEIMKNAQIARSLSKIQHIAPCNKCALKYICGGDCRIKFIKEYSDCKEICNQKENTIFTRECTDELREEYYQIMIDINHLLYS
ncbi:MAG: radical SAM protein, partial [Bacteroidales bacterium]|nr:radical SAM protein [Bacteroidales bacterium]